MNFLIIPAVLGVASALPSYIAVPADQIAFVDLSALRARRVPRQAVQPELPQAIYQDDYQPIPVEYNQQSVALAPPPLPQVPRLQHQQLQQLQQQQLQQQQLQQQQENSPVPVQQYAERLPDFGEYVDFGAHTGDNGAFGWYADYPLNNHESGYRH